MASFRQDSRRVANRGQQSANLVVSTLHIGLVVLSFAAVVIVFEADCTGYVHFRCKYR